MAVTRRCSAKAEAGTRSAAAGKSKKKENHKNLKPTAKAKRRGTKKQADEDDTSPAGSGTPIPLSHDGGDAEKKKMVKGAAAKTKEDSANDESSKDEGKEEKTNTKVGSELSKAKDAPAARGRRSARKLVSYAEASSEEEKENDDAFESPLVAKNKTGGRSPLEPKTNKIAVAASSVSNRGKKAIAAPSSEGKKTNKKNAKAGGKPNPADDSDGSDSEKKKSTASSEKKGNTDKQNFVIGGKRKRGPSAEKEEHPVDGSDDSGALSPKRQLRVTEPAEETIDDWRDLSVIDY